MNGLTSSWFNALWLERGSPPRYMCLSGTWIKEFCYQNEEGMTVNGVSHNTFNFLFFIFLVCCAIFSQKRCTGDKLTMILFLNFRKDLSPQDWVIDTEFSVINTFWQYFSHWFSLVNIFKMRDLYESKSMYGIQTSRAMYQMND